VHLPEPEPSIPDLAVTITICSWNSREDLRICLQSLRDRAAEIPFETIVIENNSNDESAEMVRSEFPEVKLLEPRMNLGFCAGHNLGVSHLRGRHWFCLNPDTVVHEGALRRMADFLDANPDVAIVGPKLLNTDGSLQFSVRRFPNPLAAAFRNTFLGRLFPNNRFTQSYLMRDLTHEDTVDADWVSGAAFMMSGRALAAVGAFDPEYFMFCEDVDLCWRSHRAGWKVTYLPEARVTHHIGRSTDKAPNRMIGRFHRSMYLFYCKTVISSRPRWQRPWLKLFAASGLGLRAGLLIGHNRWHVLRRRWRGH
jgi:GT2 family glycosyltransferase